MAKAPDIGWKSAAVDTPAAAQQVNEEIKAILEDKPEPIVIDTPPDDLITLPGGLFKKDKLVKTAVVKELTGEDEEALARASQSLNPFHFLDRLLRCGVVQLGDDMSPADSLKDLLIGDREALVLGIRKATYGDEIEIDKWKCPVCGVVATLSMELNDIPVRTMTNPVEEINFTVKFRKGGSAEVRLATGEDQLTIFENQELTQAQRETILLSRCVQRVTFADGQERSMQGYPSLAREMSVTNRHAVLNELRDRQPGPRYDEIKYKCESCGEDTLVAVGLGDLFLDFGWI